LAVIIAKENADLTNITGIELTTAGPSYRVVFGEDSFGQKKAVWVEDRVVYSVSLDEGISRADACALAEIQKLLINCF